MFVSLDLETTGIEPTKDRIIEFGAVKFDLDGKKETLQFLISPGITLPQLITHITGITDKDLKGAPPFEEKIEEIKDFIGDFPIIGHNIQFDIDFLRENNIPIKSQGYDTCQLASILLPGLPSYSLEILTDSLDLKHKEKHRALDDAIATMELFLKLARKFQELPADLIEKIHSLCQKTKWPLKDFLLSLNSGEKSVHVNTGENNSKISQPSRNEKSVLENTSNNNPKTSQSFSTPKSALFEIPPPYGNLVKTLSTKANKDSYIAIPHQLFQEIINELPDTIAKIDSPKRYISLKRLEEFEQKTFFEDYEFTALLKYLVWTKQTQTGHLSEIILFREEKSTIPQINIDRNFAEPKEEHFFKKALEKDIKSPAVCSHQYIIEQNHKIKDLIILDIDKFTRSLYYHISSYIKLDILLGPLHSLREIEPENQTIQSLISKSTILFGLIGLIFEKYNDKSPYGPRATITPLDLNLKEWKDAKTAISNLIEISQELGEIHTPKTHGYLQNWKDSLRKLEEIFKEPDLENNMVWIEQDFSENIVIEKAPFSLKAQLEEILENCKNYKIISECLDLDDDGFFIKNLLGLPENLKLHKHDTKRENLEIYILQDTPQEEKAKNFIKDTLSPYLKEKKGNTAIIFNSKQQLKYFTLELSPELRKAKIKIASQATGSLGKITEQFKQDPENSILFITPNFWENFKNHELVNTLVIHKIPFDPPSDPYIMTTSRNFSDPFVEFQIPKAVFSLKKMINRLNTQSKGQKEVLILDSRLITKGYGKAFINTLNCLTTTKTLNTANLI